MLIRRADIHATPDVTNTLLCDNDWTIIQRRVNGDVSFNRPWDEYAAGFGDVDGSFWLGLELLHTITSSENNQPPSIGGNQLHIYLESFTDGKIQLHIVAQGHSYPCSPVYDAKCVMVSLPCNLQANIDIPYYTV